jgi:hypothetical protein
MLASIGNDMTIEDCDRRSPMHCLLCEDEKADIVLADDRYGLERITQFPWHLGGAL